MLRIKEGIDLKELEKFGYEESDEGICEPYIIYIKYIAPYTKIEIYPEDRAILKSIDIYSRVVEEKDIEDLIKADMVEKV